MEVNALDKQHFVNVVYPRQAENANNPVKPDEPVEDFVCFKEDVYEIAKQLQKAAGLVNRKLEFRVNENTDNVVITVIDVETDTVIREIPSKEIQRLQAKIIEIIGLLFDEFI